jgi:hypothetical protein
MPAKEYVRRTCRGHAVADSNGKVYVHRQALYDRIGPGPHRCLWCGWDGLEWGLGQSDPNNLIVDHLNSDRADNRPDNLAATHKWCNDNRFMIERLDLPWSLWENVAPGDRPPMYNPGTKRETSAALELVRKVAVEGFEPPPEPLPQPAQEKRRRLPLADGLRSWDDALARPPASLVERFPQLHRLTR